MNDPKQPNQEPRRVSNPQPSQPPPIETPSAPQTEYEKEVPHSPNQPVAKTGTKGEGSYEGTRQYDEGLEKFTETHSNEETIQAAKKIDPNDPALKQAEKKAREGRVSSSSIH
ncbi:MAG: hypothetical protein ACXVEE_23565 [Polyangiales bacterium]